MQIGVQLGYRDIFKGDPPALGELLAQIPSRLVISFLSVINAELHLDKTPKAQIKLLAITLRSIEKSESNRILNVLALKAGGQGLETLAIFTIQSSLEFIHYEFTHPRSQQEDSGDKPETALNLFKAYLCFSQKESVALPAAGGDALTIFRKVLWPLGLNQFQTLQNNNPIVELAAGAALLNFLEFQSGHRQYVQNFLSWHSKATSWNLILDLLSLFTSAWEKNKSAPDEFYPLSISATAAFGSLLSNMCVDAEQYLKSYRDSKRNFKGLKEYPLYRINNAKLLVMNWDFLAGKLFDSLVFDFYDHSGINSDPSFQTLLKFKNFIASEFTEKVLFRKLVKGCFPFKSAVIQFDDQLMPGLPDAYVRVGKYIFLFELKDTLFNAGTIDQPDFENIKGEIDKKFNADNKGTGQLVKQIDSVRSLSVEPRSFDSLGLKHRNLVIYPILVYTDRHYSLPGVNQYLQKEFLKKIRASNLEKSFGAIKPVTMIGLKHFIDNSDLYHERTITLQDALDHYHSTLNALHQKYNKKASLKTLEESQETFEYMFYKKWPAIKGEDRRYVEAIVKLLSLTQNLPPA